MKNNRLLKSLSLILCIVLIAAMALFASGCGGDKETDKESGTPSASTVQKTETQVLGEGDTAFNFVVVDGDKKETKFEINTDKKTVGDALIELDLIEGEDGDYGLYVKTVNGITVDYDKDGKYWAFYVNGEYAMSGVDSTVIEAGATYSFKVEQ